MSEYETVELAVADEVATVTMNRPDALNAITPTMLAELNEAFDQVAADRAVRAAVLTGAGRAFSAGVDLKALGERRLDGGKVGDLLDLPARRLTELISTMPKVVVAKVNGFCFTGALELALACDLIITADEARLGDTHAKFGLRPTWGMSQRLPHLVGITRARELSLTARQFSGVEAVDYGLAARSHPAAELDGEVDALLKDIVGNSHDSLAAYKDLYRAAEDSGLRDGLDYEATTDYEIADTEERIAGFR